MNQIINPILLVIFKTNCAVVKLDECVLKSLGSMQKNWTLEPWNLKDSSFQVVSSRRSSKIQKTFWKWRTRTDTYWYNIYIYIYILNPSMLFGVYAYAGIIFHCSSVRSLWDFSNKATKTAIFSPSFSIMGGKPFLGNFSNLSSGPFGKSDPKRFFQMLESHIKITLDKSKWNVTSFSCSSSSI